VLLLIFGILIFQFLTTSLDKEKLNRMESENRNYQQTITKLNSEVNDLGDRLLQMEKLKNKIMVMAGLESPFALKEVGSGGDINVITPTEVSPSVKSKNPTNIIKDVELKLKKAKEIYNKLSFVESVIDDQKLRMAATPSIWPTRGYLTQGFGRRIHPVTGKPDFHNGQDISTQHGNEVVATANGYVLIAEQDRYLGKYIVIDHNTGYKTLYGHLASFNVREGDRVKREQVIGYVGQTGRSTAPHLHYEVRYMDKPLNPMKYVFD
jgi:murein DD-endopeptidase MepM/ murein hydrolase activator NlpD